MQGLQQLRNDLMRINGVFVADSQPLAPLTTMKVGGRAKIFLMPESVSALENVLKLLAQSGVSYKIIGNGSNLIVPDEGVKVVLSLCLLKAIDRYKRDVLYVEAGCTMAGLLLWCIKNGFAGMEPLAGIPGSIGGALFMNAGANGVQLGDFVSEILLTSSHGSAWMSVPKGFFGYRKSQIPPGTVVSAAKIRLSAKKSGYQQEEPISGSHLVATSPSQILGNIKKIMKKRLNNQPLGRPSAGCVFRNPSESCSAWALIASCGLQGKRINDAQVSTKHANFIINLGNATSRDVLDLMTLVKKRVWEETGIFLKEEVVVWDHEEKIS